MRQFSLLKKRRFFPLFITQFIGALNDNVFKNGIAILIAYTLVNETAINNDLLVILTAGVFILPFFLFSAIAGQLADKCEKSMLIRRVKLAEIGIMLLGSIGFYFMNVGCLLVALFLMGTQSTFFGPLKYSILPQHLQPEELLAGNGMIQTATYLSILIGTIGGGVLIAIQPNGNFYIAITIIILATCGWLASRAIPQAPAADPSSQINWHLFSEIKKIIQYAREEKEVFRAILAISWFWFYGASVLSLIPSYTRDILYANENIATLILASFAVGIGVGALLCNWLVDKCGRLYPILLGSIGLSVFGAIVGFIESPVILRNSTDALLGIELFLQYFEHYWILISIGLIGLSGGLYIVPLYTLMQEKSNPHYRSRIIAANNIINALFMVVATIFLMLLVTAGLSITQILLMIVLLNVVMVIVLLVQLLS